MGAKSLPENDEKQVNNEEPNSEKKSLKSYFRMRERIRVFPIWLRILVVFILAFLALALGLMFGYSVMGDGNALDVFKKATWQHIVDIVTEE
ncbi:MAG TPA: DNA-directed RNA polymerase subunit beta [Pseudogracilibacillus sp.]|nr:DNA-directed RNA polymerase subunit beta [Pseudogracilibacillus sp.]